MAPLPCQKTEIPSTIGLRKLRRVLSSRRAYRAHSRNKGRASRTYTRTDFDRSSSCDGSTRRARAKLSITSMLAE